MPTLAGQTYVGHNGAPWELATWMPGNNDYWQNPAPTKLRSALTMLASIHAAESLPLSAPSRWFEATLSPSTALQRRIGRFERLERGELAELAGAVSSLGDSGEKLVASQALEYIAACAPHQAQASQRWRAETLSLQWCLRDVWHDHVLFTGDQVTGVIDFGAAAIDSPAGDVARLLGSLVGDDREGWRLGLDAYAAVRPLSSLELDAVHFFDSSGTVLAASSWLHWLYREPAALGEKVDRPACLKRLERLVTRLRTLAASSRS